MTTNQPIIGIADLCNWLNVDIDFIHKMRRGRVGTRFPSPLLGEHGLAWYEDDIATWLCWWHERCEIVADGLDPDTVLPEPFYLAPENENETCSKR